MNILDEIDDVILWHGNSPDAYNSATDDSDDDLIDPDSIYPQAEACCCGHFHTGDCPDSAGPCGDYRCCIN